MPGAVDVRIDLYRYHILDHAKLTALGWQGEGIHLVFRRGGKGNGGYGYVWIVVRTRHTKVCRDMYGNLV